MKANKISGTAHPKWFGLALQALVILSRKSDTYPSAAIADCLKSEATQLRRVMAKLSGGQIIETREGRDGGYRLKRPPETITLAEVYIALKVGEPLCSGMLETIGIHDSGLSMKSAFMDIANEIEQNTIETLKQYTIAQLAERTISYSI
ncbi:Rrf2 family transcriptional regulator [Paenibacillus sp. LHD-38]|uniref:RrF2 family transcriptional regulator n=1 Tax=Paenibacillus sp. LHD-38 TaxID=3072143 RepID=UPI00280D9C3D|nr:Rrf2 family transcriptional regulator [Paenibacillus sp. LHD-38]MDQ8733054.1 Rrf2 family transcriptional regulator [Paenibacillus sp. LHD-38]